VAVARLVMRGDGISRQAPFRLHAGPDVPGRALHAGGVQADRAL